MRALVFLIITLLGLCFFDRPVHDPDLGWHLAGGLWISREGSLPQFDFINTFNPSWHDYHWLGQLLMYQLYAAGGYDLLYSFFGLLSVLLLFILSKVISRTTGIGFNDLRLPLILLPSAYLLFDIASVRPQMIAITIIAAGLLLLIDRRKWELSALFLLSVICVNIHVFWVFLPALWFCLRVVPRYVPTTGTEKTSVLYSWGGLFLLASAGLFSPYGIFQKDLTLQAALSNYALLWDYADLPQYLRQTISEFQGPLSRIETVAVIMLTFLVCAARNFQLNTFHRALPNWLLGLGTFALAIRTVKFNGIFAVLGLPLAADFFKPLLSFLEKRQWISKFAIVAVLIISARLVYFSFPYLAPIKPRLDPYIPFAACETIAKYQPAKMRHDHLRVLTHFNYGGWCRWIGLLESPSRDLRVTTDGRTQGSDASLFKKSFDLYALKEGWNKTLDDWDPDVILAAREHSLSHLLFLMPEQWKVLYQDGNFGVFARK